jgi:hypothetical protein
VTADAPRPSRARVLRQDLLLASLLLAGLVALGIVSDRWVFVSLCGAAVLVAATWSGERVVMKSGMWLAYVALPYGVLARVWPVQVRGLDLSLAFYQALYMSTIGAVLLAGPRGAPRVARILLVSGTSVAAAGTDIDKETYRWLVGAWALLTLFALRLDRPLVEGPAGPRRGPTAWARPATIVMILVVAASTVGGVRWLELNYDKLDQMFTRLMRRAPLNAPGGFSGKAELGSVVDLQGKGGDTVALRAFGPRAPGYLRARTFLTYEGGRWTTTDETHKEGERRSSPDGRYVLTERREVEGEPTWRIHPSARYRANLFLPLETAVVSDTSKVLDVWPGETFTWREQGSSAGYAVHPDADAPAQRTPWRPDADAPGWRVLPQDPRLLATLDAVLRARGLAGPLPGVAQVRAAVASLRNHFAERYQYHVGVTFDQDRDPVEQFLSEKDRGHCELFAASGTLLLRRLGVPARYTTGFVCEEKNAWSDQWIARNKHAHAWLEFLDPELGWTVAELTPSSGVPAPTPPAGMESFLDNLAGLFERLKSALLRFDVKDLFILVVSAIAAAFNWVFTSWWRATLAVLLVVALLVRAWRRRRAQVARARRLVPDLERDRQRLRALERALARQELGRRPSETLLEWAARLDASPADVPDRAATVDFVRGYAARRYAPGAAALATQPT